MTALSIDVVPYAGWPNALRLANQHVELVVTLDVGPRILRYATLGGANVLKEIPEQLGKAGEAEWRMRGGHRLWISPEDPARTYAPDNGPTTHGREGDAVWITTPASAETGLERTIRLQLDEHSSRVSLQHIITNRGSQAAVLAPWALTVFAPGGTAIVPLPPYAPHPGDLKPETKAEDFAAQMTLTLWPFFRFTDSRFRWSDKYICLQQDAQAKRPTKIGANLPDGWAAYHLHDTLFIKRFGWRADAVYPDRGCNFETFTDAAILELESLGPLIDLAPGQQVSHNETWSLHAGVGLPNSDDAIDKDVLPKVLQTR